MTHSSSSALTHHRTALIGRMLVLAAILLCCLFISSEPTLAQSTSPTATPQTVTALTPTPVPTAVPQGNLLQRTLTDYRAEAITLVVGVLGLILGIFFKSTFEWIRQQFVHHALCNVISPIWEARFIHDSYACRTHKGTHAALDRCTHFS